MTVVTCFRIRSDDDFFGLVNNFTLIHSPHIEFRNNNSRLWQIGNAENSHPEARSETTVSEIQYCGRCTVTVHLPPGPVDLVLLTDCLAVVVQLF